MYGKFTIIYLDLVDFYHRFVGKYTKPMDATGTRTPTTYLAKIFCGPKTHREPDHIEFQVSHEKHPYGFPLNPGWSIGILIMV